MHGFREDKSGEGPPYKSRYDATAVAAAADLMSRLLGPGMDPRKIESSTVQSQKIADDKGRNLAAALRSGNQDAFQSQFSEAVSELTDAWKIPRSISESLGLSFDRVIKLLRATRATLICVGLHGEHPLVLITRALKGDRLAVLALVKVDKLFMHDGCCLGVIRKAELQEDQKFLEQLQRALDYQARLDSRQAWHVYYYILFLLELWGVSLPSQPELWSTLDPLGREYDSLSAFEKDFQRRRLDFTRMLMTADTEVPIAGKVKSPPRTE